MNTPHPHSTVSRTSLSLLNRVRSHEQQAWDRFTRLYSPMVYSWARRSGLQDSDAADIVQDVFAVISERLDRFDENRSGSGFRSWLWGVTRNKLLEKGRALQRQPPGGGGTDRQLAIQQVAVPEVEPAVQESTRALAHRAIELIRTDFSEQTWQIFWKLMAGDSAKQVAAAMSVSISSVYTAKSRVLTHLRQELEGLDDFPLKTDPPRP